MRIGAPVKWMKFREIIDRAKRREVKLMTSVLTFVEVLHAKIPVGVDALFNDLMKRINRVSIDQNAQDWRTTFETTMRCERPTLEEK